MGGLLTQTEEISLLGGNSLPLGQVCSVGVTCPGKVGQVIHHLSAEGGVLLSEWPPAVSQCAEPVPQVAGMPGTTVITGELAVEEPAVAVGVPGTPVLGHLVEVGRNDILAGEANEAGGQKQRVAIAGIIAMLPECIVLDEPTAMLDPRGRKEVMDTCIKLNREMGMTVVFITHFMEEAVLANRVIVMDDAKIILDGTPKQVFHNSELLKKVGLDVPETAKLANDLRESGAPLPEDILSADEFSDEILKLLRRK